MESGEVIGFHDGGGCLHSGSDPRMAVLALSDEEKPDLEQFLLSVTCGPPVRRGEGQPRLQLLREAGTGAGGPVEDEIRYRPGRDARPRTRTPPQEAAFSSAELCGKIWLRG